jgi:hypothetical protein
MQRPADRRSIPCGRFYRKFRSRASRMAHPNLSTKREPYRGPRPASDKVDPRFGPSPLRARRREENTLIRRRLRKKTRQPGDRARSRVSKTSSCSGYPQSSQDTVAEMTLASLLAVEPKSRMIIESPFASVRCSGGQEKRSRTRAGTLPRYLRLIRRASKKRHSNPSAAIR